MKVLAQLLKEFWLPLLLGVAWTAYNLIDKPGVAWTVRETLNIFGPTFFFMSWLVAQWYRVRKQQRVEDGLVGLQTGLYAVQSPLLPCSLFFTLKFLSNEQHLTRAFGEHKGYRAYGANKPNTDLPPLPPGVIDARVHIPTGYIDYRHGAIKEAGIYRPRHPGYNIIHGALTHTMCSLQASEIEGRSAIGESLYPKPSSIEVEFYFGEKPSAQMQPNLRLKSSMSTVTEVVAADALDNLVFTDIASKGLDVATSTDKSWSARDLRGAHVRVALEFFFIRGINDVPEENWPALHNLQLWIGPGANRVLTFNPDQLAKQIVRRHPNPLAKGQAEVLQVLFECAVTEELYAKQVLSTA